MKYCAHCGAGMIDEAAICTKCGCPVEGTKTSPSASSSESYNTLAIVGFVLSFFTSLVGLILSIIGYKQTKESGEKGNGFALAGIIISAVSIGLGIIAFIIIIGVWGTLLPWLIESTEQLALALI